MAGIFKSKKSEDPFRYFDYAGIFDEIYIPLCRFCMQFTGEKEVAEDIVQEQFVYLWEHRERLQDITSVKSYLYAAVKNKSISYLKQKFIRNSVCTDELSESSLTGLADPATELELKELEQILEQALAQLPEKCRTIFTMKKFGEMSNKEIAQKLNISVKTVEAQTTVAFKKLTAFLAENWGVVFLLFLDHL